MVEHIDSISLKNASVAAKTIQLRGSYYTCNLKLKTAPVKCQDCSLSILVWHL